VIAAIRGKDRNADQIDEMIGRAQWFYFTRYAHPPSFIKVKLIIG
jgi:hypothetical protein